MKKPSLSNRMRDRALEEQTQIPCGNDKQRKRQGNVLKPGTALVTAVFLAKGGFEHGGFSRRLASKMPVWQRGFTDHRIRDAEEFAIRRTYIHENPVRAHLAETAHTYPFSSAKIEPPTTCV